MKAKDLIEIIKDYPEAEIKIGFEVNVQLSELTWTDEEVVERVESIYLDKGHLVFSHLSYMGLPSIWNKKNP